MNDMNNNVSTCLVVSIYITPIIIQEFNGLSKIWKKWKGWLSSIIAKLFWIIRKRKTGQGKNPKFPGSLYFHIYGYLVILG